MAGTAQSATAANQIYHYSVNLSAGTDIAVLVNGSSSAANIYVVGDNSTAVNSIAVAVGDQYGFSFHYKTA